MPTLPFLEPRSQGQDRHRQVADASDITRFRRLAATVAPFLNSTPKLGWRSPALNTEVKLMLPIFGVFKNQFPNTQ